MKNISFCYWLQGYLEITRDPIIEIRLIQLIQQQLKNISEFLWKEIIWLQDVCNYIVKLNYKPETLNHFSPLIQQRLNAIFYHYIDNNKDLDYTIEELDLMHNGHRDRLSYDK